MSRTDRVELGEYIGSVELHLGICKLSVYVCGNLQIFFANFDPSKKSKGAYAVNGYSISQLREVTCHMESHSVTCHPTQVNAPRLNSASKLALDLPTPERYKAELT